MTRLSLYLLLGVILILRFNTVLTIADASEKTIIKEPVTVSAFIGESRFTIFGYTSPNARVILQGQGMYDEVTANHKGYFIFKNRFSPLSPREVCLKAIDTLGLVSLPVCLPPFPVKKEVTIGPVYLPPTISINKQDISIGDFGAVTGRTTPGSTVQLNFYFDEESDKDKLSTFALALHPIETETNDNGYYSMNFPTNNEQTIRIFASSRFEGKLSGKSHTLSINIFPWWMITIKKFMNLLSFIKNYLFNAVFLLEISLLVSLIILGKRKRKVYPLALKPESSLDTEKHLPDIPENKLASNDNLQ